MKKLYTLLALVLTLITFAQAPQGFNYQATVRNSSGALIVNQNVNFKFNIMLNSATSLPVFSETHMAPTDDLGQVNLVIGTGTATVGTFSTINWGTGNYYLGIELNTGSGYVAMGTTQLLSVPYALYANSAGNSQAATPNLASVLAVNNSANNTKITNLADPTDAQDAVTMSYVDNATLTTTLADGSIFVGNASNEATSVTLSGDVTLTNTGVATITNTAVTTSKIADVNVTNAKLDKPNIPLSGFGAATADVNLGTKNIKNLADPIDNQDAATKMYIDNIKNQLQSQISNLQNFLMSSNAVTEEALLSLYDIFSLSGPNGEASSHVPNVDPGSGSFIRNLINLQDVSSDVAKTRWNDPGLPQLATTSGWNANNPHFASLYLRMYYAVQNCNSFLKLLNGSNAPNTILLQSETRFIRALAYYYIIDGYGKGPLITELSPENTSTILQSTRIELFNFVESELLSIQNNIAGNEYGRANRNAVRILLAKLYLNAEVYTGTAKYSEALTFINQILTTGANLADNYLKNFSGDNHTSSEIIFPLIADAVTRQSWGNTTFIIASNTSGSGELLGLSGGWLGNRGTKAWYGLFGNSATALAASPDVRAQLFTTAGHNYEMTDFNNWYDGFPSIKFRNTNFAGTTTTTIFANTDFPLFRYADVYLMYAECVLRGASGGNMTDALSYVNQVRNRSNATSITESALTLSFILDERARELNFEGHRRTDLIRFGKFTGNSYLWPWKGGVLNGTSIPDTYKLFPIPLTALQANPNLTQNPGY